MDTSPLDRLISSVLYEGYLLYPYRPSLKNTRRWTFGALYPAESAAARTAAERSSTCARLLVVGGAETVIEAQLRFLHLVERTGGDAAGPASTWHEAHERRVDVAPCSIEELSRTPRRQRFEFQERERREADSGGEVIRRQQAVSGSIELTATEAVDGVHLLSAAISNDTPCGEACDLSHRGDESLRALASAHLILQGQEGEFVSRIDPPAEYRDMCPSDPGDGLWPVLVGSPGQRDLVLCSPIILYDYPELAPESPGDFFDATEIDEMLALRIMTLSDEEKLQMARLDARGRALLERTSQLDEKQLAQLHGATRSLRTVEEHAHGL